MKSFPILPPSPPDIERLAAAGIALIPDIPWAMIAPCEERALKNQGGKTLEQLAVDGGLAAGETVAILRDWSFQLLTIEAAYLQLDADLRYWLATYGEEDGA